MIITYYGLECFKIQYSDLVVAVNPIAKESKHKAPRFGADVALIGALHPDYNGVEQVTSGGKEPFVITGPGEYETMGISVNGFPAENTAPERVTRFTTLYSMKLENMQLVFLSGLSTKTLSGDTAENFGSIDMLFIPIGGGDVLGAAEAYSLAVSLEPRLIIPMHWRDEATLQAFLKEGGVDGVKPVDKFTVKQKDLAGKQGEIIVLRSSVS